MSGMSMTLHHVGCLVEDIPAAVAIYTGTCANSAMAPPVVISAQRVQVCFLPAGNGTYIEFVQPAPDNSFLLKLMRKGINYYHLGYLCSNLEASVQSLVASGWHELTRFASEAFDGRQCVFLIAGNQQMIELIESEQGR